MYVILSLCGRKYWVRDYVRKDSTRDIVSGRAYDELVSMAVVTNTGNDFLDRT